MELIEAACIALLTVIATKVNFEDLWKGLCAFVGLWTTLWRRVKDAFISLQLPWRKVEVGAIFPTTEGFFTHSDEDDEAGDVKHYYRFSKSDGGKLMRLTPSGGVGSHDDFKVTWDFHQMTTTSCGESALPGAKYIKVVDQNLWKGTFKVNTTGSTYDSMGLNISGCALVAGHALRHREYVVLAGSNSMTAGVKVAVDRFERPSKYFEGSAMDFAIAKLTGNEWAMIGAKALSSKDFTPVAMGSVDLQFGVGTEGILHVSEGRIPQQVKAAEEAGIVLTNVSSEKGASGGVIRRYVGGVPKYMAFHVAKPGPCMASLEGKYNVAIDFDVIFAFMRAKGLYYDSVFEVVRRAAVGESLTYDWEKHWDPRNWEDCERNYEDEKMWERQQAVIDQQVHGDSWTKYELDHIGRRARRFANGDSEEQNNAESFRPPPGLDEPASVETFEECLSAPDEEKSTARPEHLPPPSPAGESAVEAPQDKAPVPSTSTFVKGAALVAAIGVPLINLDFTDVKKQVINSDFSFAATLQEAVFHHGVDAVHDYVYATDAFSGYRDYMSAVQPMWANYDDVMPDENGEAFFEKIGEYRVDGKKSATCPDRKKKASSLSEVGQEREEALRALIKDLGCEDDDWVTPENTRANVMASMAAHALLADVKAPPATEEDWNAAYEAGIKDFDTTVIASHAQQGFEGWYKLAATMADSSAGVSARYRNQSKKQWANDTQLLMTLLDLVQCRLILMMIHSSTVANYTPEHAVRMGLKDVLLLTVKREPHAPKKAKLKRFRMIWISSLVDCFVQKLLHKALNARDIDNYQSGAKSHSAAGMGHHDEGIQHLCSAFDKMFGDEQQLLTCDASMWDFTMHKEAHLNHARRRCLSCTDPTVAALLMTLAHLNYKHVCECKGDIWRCNKEGVNTSGQSSTTSDNTFSRHSQAKVCGASKFVGNGDDMVADIKFNPIEAAKFGTKSRDVVIQDARMVPFTSHHIDRSTCTASYDRPVKLAWNLLANANSSDFGLRVDAMMFVLRNTPDALEKFKRHIGRHAKGSDACNDDLLWAI